MLYANLAVRFLLELCILISIGYWGFQIPEGLVTKIGLSIGAPLITALVWGICIAPKAPIQLPNLVHLILEIIIFGCAAVALYATGHPILSGFFSLVAVINNILLYVWKQ
jgi:hypothetical protein